MFYEQMINNKYLNNYTIRLDSQRQLFNGAQSAGLVFLITGWMEHIMRPTGSYSVQNSGRDSQTKKRSDHYSFVQCIFTDQNSKFVSSGIRTF
jgi:hypothetical protein